MGISLKWKLLIPFLFFSLVGTTTLVFIGFNSQQSIIKKEERKEILKQYSIFLTQITNKQTQALSMALLIAEDRETKNLLAKCDRQGLVELLAPLYSRLKKDLGIVQFHIHVPPGKSFLRIHLPTLHGEMISYRNTIIEVMKTGTGVAGLEWGLTGLGIRGIAPVFNENALVGSIEIGFPFGRPFLNNLKESWGMDLAVYEKKGPGMYIPLASTLASQKSFFLPDYRADKIGDDPAIFIAPEKYPNKSILIGPIKDYRGDVVALVELTSDRSVILNRLTKNKNLMLFVGLAGLFVSFVLIWIVISLFIRPIKEIVDEAQQIAHGEREIHLDKRPDDEIGELARSLNAMLDSLNEKRMQLENYARTLETRVRERTADLVDSEEKYRSLVDNLPLIVYRLLPDGTTEFINPYFTSTLGYTAEEAVGNKNFWFNNIWNSENTVKDISHGDQDITKEQRIERVVRAKDGQLFTFMDHAIPRKDDYGNIKWVDGIMLDITELKTLQERAIRSEEIRTLNEISARFAHELRNPLVIAGGFARRLKNSLTEDDRKSEFAQIIVEEVARLEDIVQKMLVSIEPIYLCIDELNINDLLQSWIIQLADKLKSKEINLVKSMPQSALNIHGDPTLLNRAFESLLRQSILTIPKGEKLFLSLTKEHNHIEIVIRHRIQGLANEDLQQFFFPRFTSKSEPAFQDLPLSKIIIHRHGGKIDVFRENGDYIVLRIELPFKPVFDR